MPPRAAEDTLPVDQSVRALGPAPGHASGMDETKRSFLRMASHELRTPLNSVIGFSEIIARELYGPVGDPRYREHAEIIRDSGHKLLKLVNQVLEIARLESGAAELDIQPEPPGPAAEAAIRAVAGDADQRGVRVELQASPAAPLVLADARALHTALVNLLQNAVAFSPDGGVVRLQVSARRGAVVFDIRDEGEGVSPEDLHRLVRPFEQGENALVRRTGGAGLGLSIVRLLCREMGGRLSLRSAPGQGLAARLRLPSACDVEADASGATLEPARSAA